jgi:hypothetical protein
MPVAIPVPTLTLVIVSLTIGLVGPDSYALDALFGNFPARIARVWRARCSARLYHRVPFWKPRL